MTQPAYVPLAAADRVRPAERLPVPDAWRPDRPADFADTQAKIGPFGVTGPDQGYALKLARRFDDRLVLAEGEQAEDAVAGCLGVALARAALFGRAPVIYDLELAFTLFGFLGGAPPDLVAFRKPLFASASHHYWDQRAIVALVPETTLRLTPAEVAERLADWKTLVVPAAA